MSLLYTHKNFNLNNAILLISVKTDNLIKRFSFFADNFISRARTKAERLLLWAILTQESSAGWMQVMEAFRDRDHTIRLLWSICERWYSSLSEIHPLREERCRPVRAIVNISHCRQFINIETRFIVFSLTILHALLWNNPLYTVKLCHSDWFN